MKKVYTLMILHSIHKATGVERPKQTSAITNPTFKDKKLYLEHVSQNLL